MKKKIIVLCSFITVSLLVFLSILFTVAHFVFKYYESDKTFTKSGLSITLTNDFHEKELVEYTAYYSSSEIMVFLTKAEYKFFDNAEWIPENKTSQDYAKKIRNEYKALYPSISEIFTDNELVYFTFDFQGNGKNYKYTVFSYKASDSFWTVTFACYTKNHDSLKEEITRYAQTVTTEK